MSTVSPGAKVVWVACDEGDKPMGVYSTLERAIYAVHEELVGIEQLPGEPGDTVEYTHAPVRWQIHHIDDAQDIAMCRFICTDVTGEVTHGSVRAYQIDEFLPETALFDHEREIST